MKIEFIKRNEEGLHCRFCNNVYESTFRIPRLINLYETKPVRGIVCSHCRVHLENYVESHLSNSSDADASSPNSDYEASPKVCPCRCHNRYGILIENHCEDCIKEGKPIS